MTTDPAVAATVTKPETTRTTPSPNLALTTVGSLPGSVLVNLSGRNPVRGNNRKPWGQRRGVPPPFLDQRDLIAGTSSPWF